MRLEFPMMQKYMKNRPLSLSQYSLIRISKHLWIQPDLKHLLISCIKANNYWSFTTESTDLKTTLCAQLSHEIDQFFLPKPIEKQLRFTVASMGMRLWEWAHKMERHGNSSVDLGLYIDHICWTDDGCINASATLESMYLCGALPETIITWMELCEHCLELCITDFWPKISNMDEHMFGGSRTALPVYWSYRMLNCSECELETVKAIIPGYNEEYSLQQNMFEYSFINDNFTAANYFWRWLSNDQRKRMIIEVTNKLINGIGADLQSDLIIFLLQQIVVHELHHLWIQLLSSKDALLKLLKWPYQDLFTFATEELWIHHESISYTSIFLEIFRSIESSFLTADADYRYREIFNEMWERTVADRRGSIDFLIVLEKLWKMRDIELLNHVISDARLEGIRSFHVFYMLRLFAQTTNYIDTQFAEKFVSDVLVSDTEREGFRFHVRNTNREVCWRDSRD